MAEMKFDITKVIDGAIKEFKHQGYTVSKWISCKDKMPEDGISVLICSYRGTVSKATYDSDMGYFYIADSELHYNELDITHWQPLPEPPKDGEQNDT